METLIDQIKQRIASEENIDVRMGLRIALLLAQEQFIKELNNQLNQN